MRKCKPALILLCACLLCGCAALGEYVDIVRPVTLSKDYRRALDKWTREKTAYSEFETRVKIVATWKHREFNDAYWTEYARFYDLSASERRARQDAAHSDATEFLFYAYTPDREANTFAHYGSIWKIFLIDGKGNRHEPREVREIREVSPLMVHFYPYVQPSYGKAYRLAFSPASVAGTGDATLVFTSVLARVELVW